VVHLEGAVWLNPSAARSIHGWRTPHLARTNKGHATQEKAKKKKKKKDAKAQHRAFPRGPPPQYYPGSNLLNFAVRMGSGEPG
tara:strand:- start:214 stop:462 length:249 start_codon:yes stop_codon:yes gene_type:complete